MEVGMLDMAVLAAKALSDPLRLSFLFLGVIIGIGKQESGRH